MVNEKLTVAPGGLDETSPDIARLIFDAHVHSGPFIDGEFVEPVGGRYYDNIGPANGNLINQVADCDSRDIEKAVVAARRAFERGSWSRLAPGARKKSLLHFADEIEKHADELAALDAVDVGKPFEAARSVDVQSALNTIRWYAEAIDKVYGEVAPTATLDVIVRQPLGVVGAIVPWNYPLMIAAWKFGPTLAAGNCVVLKPAEQSPLSVLRVAELAADAGIPAGVFNVVPGFGPTAGAPLGRHAGVDGIAFTGSTKVGKLFFGYSAESNIKSISLECGGKAPCIVADDADLEQAAIKVAGALFYNAGQSCNAPARILAQGAVASEFSRLLAAEAKKYYPNNPLRHGTRVGAVVNAEQFNHIHELIESGIQEGAKLVVGGRQCYEGSGGYYYEPTIMTNARVSMRICQEEIFGPVAPIETFRTIEEAAVLANSTKYGLWANVWTKSLQTAVFLSRAINAGTVSVNNVFGGDITTPFGGFKESGTGRDRSLHAFYKYTQLKHMHFNL